VAGRWIDLVDPSSDELHQALPVHVDPEVFEALATRQGADRAPRPLLEGHGSYAFGVLIAMRPLPEEDRVEHQEVDFVATPELLVTVRKTPPGGIPYDPAALRPAADESASVGVLIHRLVDDVAETYLGLVDALYSEIDEIEDRIDEPKPAAVPRRLSEVRQELIHRRRTATATRAAVRRVLDGRVDVGDHELFPPEIERRFGDTYDTLVRAAEELDIARDLLTGVRDHYQAKITENQNEIGKKLTVIASMVLVPTFIVGFYGQNFDSAFDQAYWSVGVSSVLIVGSMIVLLALYRWRRWI
jgi:magnesium transporter